MGGLSRPSASRPARSVFSRPAALGGASDALHAYTFVTMGVLRPSQPRLAALFTLLLALSSAPVALAGVLVFEGTLEQSGYPTGDATTLAPSLAWRTSRWSLSLTVPLLRQSVGELIRVGPGVTPQGPPSSDPGTASDDDGGGSGNDESTGDGGNGNGDSGGGDGGSGDGGGDGSGGGNGGGNVLTQPSVQAVGQAAGRTVEQAASPAGDPTEPSTPKRRSTNRTGLGDPVLRLDVALPGVLGAGTRLGLFGAVKIPLADADLGTEEWDAGAGVFAWRTGLLTDVYVEVGYWALGDPDAYELSDPIAWRAVLSRRLASGRWAFAALTQGATEVVGGAGSSAEVGVWAGRLFRATRSFGLSVTAGLDDAAPDWSATLSWRLGVAGLRPQTVP